MTDAVEQVEKLLSEMTPAEKGQVLQTVARELGEG
jgi:uncharacterized protein YoaH (UPF0181 family)